MAHELEPIAAWRGGTTAFDAAAIAEAASRFREPVHVVREPAGGRLGVAFGGEVVPERAGGTHALLGSLPALYPEWLGDRSFLEAHGLRFPYLAGAMANGISSPAMVVAMARAGMMGTFGAAGLPLDAVERALAEIETGLAGTGLSWGSNLIHSPDEPDLESALADLYLRRGVLRVCASAFMGLTPAVVRYACTGLAADGEGRVRRRHRVLAKVSRPEVARHFLSPAPPALLGALVDAGKLTRDEAALAVRVPVAEDVTVEADSGGHTDNRPLGSLFPTIAALRDEVAAAHGYPFPVRLGAAGGLGTPSGVAAAFALGAAYVMTGSVNQAAVESGLSAEGRLLLAEAGIADVVMAPAADMFEMGVKVQVLRRGTMFGPRALRLHEAWTAHGSIEALPAPLRERLEREVFRAPLEAIWEETRRFFEGRDPREVERADKDPRHRFALVCRWYLGKSSRWPVEGLSERRMDWQIWCGPAQGAFNAWTAGSFLADPARRDVVAIARNLLEGAAAVTRAQQLRSYGVPVPAAAFDFRPRELPAAPPDAGAGRMP